MKTPRLLRAALLALLLLPVWCLGQVVEVSFGEHTATVNGAAGFAKLTKGGSWRGDVAVHLPEVVVMNGAVENYLGPDGITGPLRITVDDVVVVDEASVTIFDACGKVYYVEDLVFSPDRRGSRWLKWYVDGGPDVPVGQLGDVLGFHWGGPNPDPVDAGATGSGRVAWLRWPLGTAISLGLQNGQQPTAAQWQEVMRWSADQWDRAYHAYYAEGSYRLATLEGGEKVNVEDEDRPAGRRWEAWEDPNAIMGRGYRSAGGFWNTYGRTELHGRTHTSRGKYPPDEQHADMAGLVWTVAATGSWAAQRSAASLIEARCSFPPFSEGSKVWSQSVRELGWVGRCLALYYGATGDAWCLRYIDKLESILDELGGSFGGRYYAHLQKASDGANGYVWLSPAVREAFAAAGYSDDEMRLAMRQTSGWQSAILGITCGNMADALEMSKPDGWPLRVSKWNKHELVVAILILENLRAPGVDNTTLEHGPPLIPGEHGFVLSESYSPAVNAIKAAKHNYVIGTGLVTLGFVEQFALRNPKHAAAAHVFADEWIDYLIGVNYVDSGWLKGNLDRLFLSAGRRGWMPVK